MLFCHLSSCVLWIIDLFSSSNTLKQSNLSSSSNTNNAGSYNSRPPCMSWFIRGSRSGNASRWSANETSRETEKIFSPSMLDSIVVGVRQWCVRWKFLAISVVFRTVDEVSIGISVHSSSKRSSTRPMVLPMSILGSASGNTITSGGGSTSTPAPPPPPPPQPHIGDKDKLVDESALDTLNAADTLAGEMSPTPSTSSDLDQGGDGDVELAEMSMFPSVSGASSLSAASKQTGLTSWHASEGCRSEAGRRRFRGHTWQGIHARS